MYFLAAYGIVVGRVADLVQDLKLELQNMGAPLSAAAVRDITEELNEQFSASEHVVGHLAHQAPEKVIERWKQGNHTLITRNHTNYSSHTNQTAYKNNTFHAPLFPKDAAQDKQMSKSPSSSHEEKKERFVSKGYLFHRQ